MSDFFNLNRLRHTRGEFMNRVRGMFSLAPQIEDPQLRQRKMVEIAIKGKDVTYLFKHYGPFLNDPLLLDDYGLPGRILNGKTIYLIHVAVAAQKLNMVEKLVEHNRENLTYTTQCGRTLLHLVALDPNCSKELVDYLARRTKPKLLDGFGKTPMHYACENSNYTFVETMLFVFDTDDKTRDRGDNTPYQLAKQSGNYAIVNLISVYRSKRRNDKETTANKTRRNSTITQPTNQDDQNSEFAGSTTGHADVMKRWLSEQAINVLRAGVQEVGQTGMRAKTLSVPGLSFIRDPIAAKYVGYADLGHV